MLGILFMLPLPDFLDIEILYAVFRCALSKEINNKTNTG